MVPFQLLMHYHILYFYYRSLLPFWPPLFLLKLMPMLGMDMVDISTNKPGLVHVDLDSKAPATDAVSQLIISSANVKPKLNHITDMVVMDMVATDMDMDTVTVTDTVMVTTLERDPLNLSTDTDTHTLSHMLFLLDLSPPLLDQLESLDMEPEPHTLPEAHKESEARDPLNHTMVMDSTDMVHTDTAQESLDTQEELHPLSPEAHKDLANKHLVTRELKSTFKR